MKVTHMMARTTAILLVSSLLVVGCGGAAKTPAGDPNSSTTTSTPKAGGTLTLGRPTDAISLDPQMATTAPEVWVYNNIFETLVNLDEKMELKPGLAESWERTNDTTMRFHLRKGVTFQDGTPFNAAAVKFTIERVIDPKSPARGRAWIGPVSGAKVIDDNTVDITTSIPFGPLLNHLSEVFVVGMVSPTAVQKYGADFGHHPVGTGPFTFQDWQANDHINLVRNDAYWGQKAHLDKVTFKVIPEESARSIAYERGDVDFLLHPAPVDLARFRADKQSVVDETPGLRTLYIGLNSAQAPTNDVKVREAITHAIDVPQINEFVVENAMLPAKGVITPQVFGFKDTGLADKYKFDLNKTSALLTSAGYTKGADGMWQKGGKPLELSFWFSQGRDLKDKEISEAAQAQLTKAGFKVNVNFREWAAHLTALTKETPTYNLFTMGWVTMTGDGDFGLYAEFHSSQIPPGGTQYDRYQNANVDKLLDDARTNMDQAKRKADYEQAQELIVGDYVWVPIYQTKEIHVLKSYVQGYVGHPAEYYVRLNTVWLNK